MSGLAGGDLQQFEIRKPGKRVTISDTVRFTEALIELAEKLSEVMAFVSVEGEGENDLTKEER